MCPALAPPLHLDVELYRDQQLQGLLIVQLLPFLVRRLAHVSAIHVFCDLEQRERIWDRQPVQIAYAVELDLFLQRLGPIPRPTPRHLHDPIPPMRPRHEPLAPPRPLAQLLPHRLHERNHTRGTPHPTPNTYHGVRFFLPLSHVAHTDRL